MRTQLRWAGAAIGILIMVGGCTDSPVDVPTPNDIAAGGRPVYETLQGCVTGGICLVEPIVVGPATAIPGWTWTGARVTTAAA